MNNTIPSVCASMRLLDRLSRSSQGESQMALADALGLSKSTTYRILQSLISENWIRKDARGTYRLASGLLPMLESLHGTMVPLDEARRAMMRIAHEMNIASKLSIRRGEEQVVVARETPDGPFQGIGGTGVSYPLAEGSSGAALLMDDPQEELDRLLKRSSGSQTGADFMRASFESLRTNGYCVRDRIRNWSITAISAPVRSSSGEILASMTLLVPCSEFDERRHSRLLLAAVGRFSETNVTEFFVQPGVG